jgi:hypothetical protein
MSAAMYGQAPAAQPPAPFGVNVSAIVDGYYNYTPNHPASKTLIYRNFDVRTNTLSLNMAKIALAHDADPIGFRIDFGFGRFADIFNFQDTANGFDTLKYIPQAYLSVKPASWHGVQIDFGKFYTSAGAELTETHLAANYSRSLIYTNGPYYHFGVRATMPLSKSFTAGVQLVNGWNNVEDTNSGKTLGLTTAWVMGKATWYNNYYVGPEDYSGPGTATSQTGVRQFYDTVLAVATNKVNAYVNFDYGNQKVPNGTGETNDWLVFGAAAQFKFTPKFSITPRWEYYYDKDGYILAPAAPGQELKEITVTGEYKFTDNFLSRVEYRRDYSNVAIFERGNGGLSKNQDTFVLGMVFSFDNYKVNFSR